MVLIGVYTHLHGWLAAFAVPIELAVVHVVDDIAQLAHLGLHSLNAVRLLDLQRRQAAEVEVHILQRAAHDKGLRQVGRIGEVVFQSGNAAVRVA